MLNVLDEGKMFLNDRCAETTSRAATLRQTLRMTLAVWSSCSMLTSGQPVRALVPITPDLRQGHLYTVIV